MSSFPHLLDQRRLIGPGGATVSGTMYFYYSGTEILAPIYADASLDVPFENPIEIAAGEIIPSFFMDKAILYRRRIIYVDGTMDDEDPLGELFTEGEFGVPVGTVMDYAGIAAPGGFLFCYGQEVSRAGYPELFNAIGTNYGSGNGSTTFNLPDYRGRVGAGKDNMGGSPAGRLTIPVAGSTLGAVGGSQQHTLIGPEMPAHTHTIIDPGHAHTYGKVIGGGTGLDSGSGGVVADTQSTSAVTGITMNVAGGDPTNNNAPVAHNNTQPTIVFNKIIKSSPTSLISLASMGIDLSNKANASALGVSPTAKTMGSFSNGVIRDNATARQALDDLEVKALELRSVSDFASPEIADASGLSIYMPGTVTTTLPNFFALEGRYWGVGEIRTADGRKQARHISTARHYPTSQGNGDDISTAYDGDWSQCSFPIAHMITGEDTLGKPTVGYTFVNECAAVCLTTQNYSGHNQELASNEGRTGALGFRSIARQYGQGDCTAYQGSGFVASNKIGATHFLAQPAVSLFGGDIAAGADHVYLNPAEIIAQDKGYDVACVMDVRNMLRTNATGAQGVVWLTYRAQSVGSVAADSILSATGLFKNGLDFSMSFLDFGPNKAAISLKMDDRYYGGNASSDDLRTTVYNGQWFTFGSALHAWNFVVDGSSRLQIGTAQVSIVGAKLFANSGVQLTNLGVYADNAAAAAAGLGAGNLYRTGIGVLMIRY